MTEKEKILARIREALTVHAPFSGAHHDAMPHTTVANVQPSFLARTWLPLVGETFDARLALFQKNCADLKSTLYVVNSAEELAKSLRNLCDVENWKKIGIHSGALTDEAIRV